MNIVSSRTRGAASSRIWTEHDDELLTVMADLFGDTFEPDEQEAAASRRPEELTPACVDG